MQLLALARTGHGFRGCLIDQRHYRFFHLSAGGRLRWLKDYPLDTFESHDHFLAVMLKYLLPATIFFPPIEISELTMVALKRLIVRSQSQRSETSSEDQDQGA